MKFNVCFGLFRVTEFAWTYQVHTQCVPGNDFWIGLRWKQTFLLVTLLACCAISQRLHARAHVDLSPIHVQRCAVVSSSLC